MKCRRVQTGRIRKHDACLVIPFQQSSFLPAHHYHTHLHSVSVLALGYISWVYRGKTASGKSQYRTASDSARDVHVRTSTCLISCVEISNLVGPGVSWGFLPSKTLALCPIEARFNLATGLTERLEARMRLKNTEDLPNDYPAFHLRHRPTSTLAFCVSDLSFESLTTKGNRRGRLNSIPTTLSPVSVSTPETRTCRR